MDKKLKSDYMREYRKNNPEKMHAIDKKAWDKKKDSYNEKRRENNNQEENKADYASRKLDPGFMELARQRAKQWRIDNPEKHKHNNLMSSYGISLDKFKEMLLTQDNKCRTCGANHADFKKGLHVDHCHKSKVVRGLLCSKCNTAIGLLKENIEVLENIINYLKQGYTAP